MLTVRHSYFQINCGKPTGSFYPRAGSQTVGPEESKANLRLGLISDIHGIFCQISPRRLLKQIKNASVDAVIFAGDVSTWQADRAKGLSWLKEFSKGLDELGLCLYAVPGNHDHGLTEANFRDNGMVPLFNRSAEIKGRTGRSWLLIGLEDLIAGKPNINQALSSPIISVRDKGEKRQIAYIPPEDRIVIAHNPDIAYTLNSKEAKWLLSGHYHAGQIRLPWRLEFKTLRSDGLAQEGIYDHHYQKNGLAGYITNGIGCVLLPIRFLAPPELSILDFH